MELKKKRPAKKTLDEVDLKDAVRALPPRAPMKAKAPKLLTADPGTRKAGVAYFDQAELVSAELLAPPVRLPIGRRVALLGDMTVRWANTLGLEQGSAKVAIEFPEIYPEGPGGRRVNPRDVMWVGLAAGAILTGFDFWMLPAEEVTSYFPKEWKKQVKKHAHNEIARDVLTAAERKVLGNLIKDDNVMDAVAIGLFYNLRIQ